MPYRRTEAEEDSGRKKLKAVFSTTAFSAIHAWCRPVRRAVMTICLMNVLSALVILAVPLTTRELVDSAVGGATDRMWVYGLCLALCIVLGRVFFFLGSDMQNKTAAAFQAQMQRLVARELLSGDYAKIRLFHSGELVNRLFSDVTVIKTGLTEVLPSLLRTAVAFVGAAVILSAMDWRFVPVMLVGSAAWAGLTALFRKPMKTRHKRMQEAEDALHAVSQETLENIRVVKASGSEERALNLIGEETEGMRNAQIRNGKLAVFMKNGIGGVMDLSWLLCYLWGCIKIFRGEFTYGNLAAMIPLVGRIQNPVANAANMMGQIYGITASAERLQEILQLPEDEDLGGLEDFDRIVLKDVCFRYEDGIAEVLRGVNGEIRKGDFIALTGASGEGKTSLFQLLLGIYKPDRGSVSFVQGERTVPASKGIRKLFAYVPQGNSLFSGSLRDNLLMFTDRATEEEIHEALRVACVGDLAEEIGLEAVLGERGVGLSEGQAQRVAIARAILSKAPILLLDEATSALDEETEARLLENIAGLRAGKQQTVLIVTHRPAALQICDRQWRIEQGQINEFPSKTRKEE